MHDTRDGFIAAKLAAIKSEEAYVVEAVLVTSNVHFAK